MFVDQLHSLMSQAVAEQHAGEVPPGPRQPLQGVTGGIIPQGGPMIAQHAVPGVATQLVPPPMVPDWIMQDPVLRQRLMQGQPVQFGYPGAEKSFAFGGQLPEQQLLQLRGALGTQRPQQRQQGVLDRAALALGAAGQPFNVKQQARASLATRSASAPR